MNHPMTSRLIKHHEGLRLRPYRDLTGHLTIGYGRNLEDVGISLDEAELMLSNDLRRAEAAARELVPVFDELSEVRQAVLVDMAYNLGARRLASFRRMRAALERHDYERAALEMLDSRWARQVGARAERLAQMMRSGRWPQEVQECEAQRWKQHR